MEKNVAGNSGKKKVIVRNRVQDRGRAPGPVRGPGFFSYPIYIFRRLLYGFSGFIGFLIFNVRVSINQTRGFLSEIAAFFGFQIYKIRAFIKGTRRLLREIPGFISFQIHFLRRLLYFTRRLLYGLPVLAAFGFCVYLAFAVDSAHSSAGDFAQLAKDATAKSDWNNALFYSRAALQLEASESNLFQLSDVHIRMGDWKGGAQLLEPIFADRSKPHYSSHLSMALLMLREKDPNPKRLQEIERHLQAAANAPDDTAKQAAAILGEIYFRSGRFAEAAKYLKQSPDGSYGRLFLAAAGKRTGDASLSREELNKFLQFRLSDLEKNPGNSETRLLVAGALAFQGEYEKSIETLDQGIALAPNEKNLLAIRVQIYIQWLNNLEANNSPPADRFAILDRALKAAPDNAELIAKLNAFSNPQSKEFPLAKAILEKQLKEGRSGSATHFVLAGLAWQQDKKAEALSHLERAFEEDPTNESIKNNLAFALASSSTKEADWNRALTLSRAVVEKNPGNPQFRQTRGLIYYKLKLWKEAILDLEFSMSAVQESTKYENYAMLETAYRELGLSELAAKYQLMKSKGPPKR